MCLNFFINGESNMRLNPLNKWNQIDYTYFVDSLLGCRSTLDRSRSSPAFLKLLCSFLIGVDQHKVSFNRHKVGVDRQWSSVSTLLCREQFLVGFWSDKTRRLVDMRGCRPIHKFGVSRNCILVDDTSFIHQNFL